MSGCITMLCPTQEKLRHKKIKWLRVYADPRVRPRASYTPKAAVGFGWEAANWMMQTLQMLCFLLLLPSFWGLFRLGIVFPWTAVSVPLKLHITILLHGRTLQILLIFLCFRPLIPNHSWSLPFQWHSPMSHGDYSVLLALPGSGSHSIPQLSTPMGLLPHRQPWQAPPAPGIVRVKLINTRGRD